MTVTYHVMWMLCALGAITFGAAAARSRGRMAAFWGGFAMAAAWGVWRGLPDAPVVGALAAVAVAAYLFLPRYGWIAAAGGGLLGAVWPELLWLQGISRVVAWPVVLLAIALAAWLARTRPQFAPKVLEDDALLVVMATGLVLAVLPGVLDGWQAALALNMSGPVAGADSLPRWLVAVVAGALLVGGMHSVWSRR